MRNETLIRTLAAGAVFAAVLTQAAAAFADDVVITSYYPIPYGEYKKATAETVAGGTSTVSSKTEINGDASVSGNVTITNSLVRVAPNTGPYGLDGLRITTAGYVSIGDNDASTALFRAHTVLAGRELYALDYDSGLPVRKYGLARGFLDITQVGNLQKKAQFAAKLDNGTPDNFADDTVYAPMRVDGHYIRFGEKMADYPNYTPQGNMNNVLIGTQTLDTTGLTVPQDRVFLQVGAPGDGTEARGDFTTFSSREYKKDIVPLAGPDLQAALADAQKIRVVRYRLKGDKPGEKPRLGLIAEEVPDAMATADRRAIPLSDAMGYLTAALKGLQARNEALKTRIAELEKRKAALERV